MVEMNGQVLKLIKQARENTGYWGYEGELNDSSGNIHECLYHQPAHVIEVLGAVRSDNGIKHTFLTTINDQQTCIAYNALGS